jgi:diguanylate cyclase (GGDEF)-like protein/PAS domain S-box-containing protein
MSETPIRIGLVEDDPLDVELFQEMLREPPEFLFELHHSARLDQALEMLASESPDVLLLDLWLPDCQGLEVFYRVKSRAPHIPIIIFSGRSEKELAIRAVADGAQDYLVKGQISAHTLKRAIHYAIERQRAARKELARAAFAVAAAGIVTLTLEGTPIQANPAFCNMLGYSEVELRALDFYALIHPDDRSSTLESVNQLLAGKIDDFIVEKRYLRKDGSAMWANISVSLIRSANGKPASLIAVAENIDERKRREEELARAIIKRQILFEQATDAIVVLNKEQAVVEANASFAGMLGYTLEEVSKLFPWDWDAIYTTQEKMLAKWPELPLDPQTFETKWRRRDSQVIDVEISTNPSLWGGEALMFCICRDISKRKQAELELTRLNRALRMLSACNESLIRATNEMQLLTEICRIVVEIGGYRVAWVGYAQHDAASSIKPMGYAGPHAGYISKIGASWSEDSPKGKGPAGKTIRTGAPVICEDILKDPDFTPWLKAAKKYGYRGLICLPLNEKDRTFGLLALYSDEVRSFPQDEIRLLQEMADDLAFGIANLRAQDEHRRIHSAVLKVATGVSASSGMEFFEQLARNMVEALDAQVGIVAQLRPGQSLTARTIALVIDGQSMASLDYILAGTPCEHVISGEGCMFERDIQQIFAQDQILRDWEVEGYVGTPLKDSKGKIIGFMSVLFREPLRNADFINSTLQIFAARAAAELERRETDQRVRDQASLLDKAKDAIIVRDLDHRIHFWNKGAERLYGWTTKEAVGKSIEKLLYDDITEFRAATESLLKQGDWSGEIVQVHKDRSSLVIEGHWTLVRDDDGQPQSILAINTDISQRKAVESEIQHLAFYDPLTGLPNRLLLLDRLQQALIASVRTRQAGALLFIDLDNFKTLNDTVGHDVGDMLLKEVATRLVSCVRESDTVARLGGDEFVILLEDLSSDLMEAADHARAVGEKIITGFIQPFELRGYPHHSTPSIGVTMFNDQQTSVDELLKRADLAMYQAKASGRNTMRFFDPEMQAIINERVVLEADLRQGLQYSEFELHYQPQVNNEGAVIGAEALARWQHPRRGMVPPAQFIPVAEDTGLILLLGHWVLETACLQLVAWASQEETAQLTLAVNVSVRQFRQPDFVAQVLEVLENTGANPERLKLELTETLLVENVNEVIAKMTVLKERGVRFSLDDFGTGYSSLAYLKLLPLDQLKIDQSFVRDVLTDTNDAAIARTIIALGQSLGLGVIAEGVETQEQRDFLETNGCKAYQGFLFSKPLPVMRFNAFVKNSTT